MHGMLGNSWKEFKFHFSRAMILMIQLIDKKGSCSSLELGYCIAIKYN